MLTRALLLRPDREEASVMPLINAGFNRVSDSVFKCVSSAKCVRIDVLIRFNLSVYKAGVQIWTVHELQVGFIFLPFTCVALTLRDMWKMPIWWPATTSCYSWSMERCGHSSNWGESRRIGVMSCVVVKYTVPLFRCSCTESKASERTCWLSIPVLTPATLFLKVGKC